MHDKYIWRRSLHVPVIIVLQVIFIILFGRYVIYDPTNAQAVHPQSVENGINAMKVYPMFQDVHVMIFIGFGFLMTFLKKYGLSAVSLNMLIAVLSIEWATLVIGFFHMHDHVEYTLANGTVKEIKFESPGYIFLDLTNSMLLSDFAAATVLISFGVVIGKTSPLQLIIMALIEIVLFVVNEVIGRQYLGAVDAGDSIFVHTFGAYFGLAISFVLYDKNVRESSKAGAGYTSDLFSMIGTVFLWLFWPSFNGAVAAAGDPQHRAVMNTYYSLCGSVMASFAVSAATNEHKKFVMEHIQNATLAGGVAIGACADMMMQPYGALIVGTFAGVVSTLGYSYVSEILDSKLRIHDTCGVNNLHGMPGIIGTLLSVIMAALATKEEYGKGLTVIFPALEDPEFTAKDQANMQLAALFVTLAIAIAGGLVTGLIMRYVGKFQHQTDNLRKGSTIVRLALNIGDVMSSVQQKQHITLPKEAFFDDNLYFEVNEDKEELVVEHEARTTTVPYEKSRRGSTYHM